MNIQLKRFDPRMIKSNTILVFIGKRGTGKSTLVRDILSYHKHIPSGVVFSSTEESNGYWGKHIPDVYIHDEYDPDVMQAIVDLQRKKRSTDKEKPPPGAFILCEDCMADRHFAKDKTLRGVFFNGRHWNILLLITMQYCLGIDPALRANIDYLFITRENILQNRERLYKHFFGIVPTFDAFVAILNHCTDGHDVLVLDNTTNSTKIEDNLFYYRAKADVSFHMGGESYWKNHYKRYDELYATR